MSKLVSFIVGFLVVVVIGTGLVFAFYPQKELAGVNDFSPFYIRNNTLDDGLSTTTQAVLRNTDWFVGIGTTSPYAPLSVAGEVVVQWLTATSTSATSTIAYGLDVTNGGVDINLPSCDSLDTNSNGSIICGSDATGAAGGGPGWVVRSLGNTKYDTSSSTSDTFVALFEDGFVSSGASSSISDTVNFTATATTTFSGGVFANALRTNFPSCTQALETDSTGAIICGTDATGGGFNYPFDHNATYNSTTTILGFLGGLFAQGSSTITGQLNVDAGIIAVDATGTSTFAGGINATGGGIDINLPSCSGTNALNTDSGGAIICGAISGLTQDDLTDNSISDLSDVAAMTEATGDLLYVTGGAWDRLAAGTRGTIFSMTTGGIPGWISTSTFAHLNANNIYTGSGTTTLRNNEEFYGRIAIGGTSTSTIRGNGTSTIQGLTIPVGGLNIALPSCDSIDTDSTGALICGSDATAAAGTNDWGTFIGMSTGKNLTPSSTMDVAIQGELNVTGTGTSTIQGNLATMGVLTVGASSSSTIRDTTATSTLGGLIANHLQITKAITQNGGGTSTFVGGIFANTFRTNLPSCDTLDTDSTGALICGTDATGAGGAGQVDFELFNNVGQRATTTGKSLFVRGDYTSTTTQDRLEVAGRATIHHLLTAGYFTATSTVSTSTIAYGLDITNGGLDINLPSCNSASKLITDSNGAVTCALEALDGAYTGTYDGNNFGGGAIGAGELIYGGSAGSFSELAAGTRGNVLMFGTGALPIWQSTSTLAWESDTSTSTFVSGISVGTGGLASSDGISLTGGVLNSSVTATSVFSGGLSISHLTTSDAITVNGAGTSTFTGGIFTNDLRTNLPSCTGATTLDTDANGALVCGADADTTYTAGANLSLTGTIFSLKTNLFSMGDVFATTSSASMYASSTVQAGGNLIGYADLLVGGTTTRWGGVTIEQQSGQGFMKPIFVVGDSGTSTPFFTINQKGQITMGTTTDYFSQGKSNATSTKGALVTPYLVVDNGHNGTTTIQIGDIGSKACLKIRDADNGGWTFCKTENGAMQCSLTSC